MAVKVSDISLISLVILMLWNGATAQSGCTMALVSLSPCLNYVGGNSSSPSSSCCSQLSSVVQSQPQCLCALLKGGVSFLGIAINQTLALALPGACNVQTPPQLLHLPRLILLLILLLMKRLKFQPHHQSQIFHQGQKPSPQRTVPILVEATLKHHAMFLFSCSSLHHMLCLSLDF
ncbi:hypothetical protein Pfo_006327, partial [Paulownia fortunei]